MTGTKIGMEKPKYHYKNSLVVDFRVEITSKKAIEQLLIESLFKYVLQEDCILVFSGSRSFFCHCESVTLLSHSRVCDRKWQRDFKPVLLCQKISKASNILLRNWNLVRKKAGKRELEIVGGKTVSRPHPPQDPRGSIIQDHNLSQLAHFRSNNANRSFHYCSNECMAAGLLPLLNITACKLSVTRSKKNINSSIPTSFEKNKLDTKFDNCMLTTGEYIGPWNSQLGRLWNWIDIFGASNIADYMSPLYAPVRDTKKSN
jgi:hypothetical protein